MFGFLGDTWLWLTGGIFSMKLEWWHGVGV